MEKRRMQPKKIAFMGIMLALILLLVWLERMLPPLPFLPPTMKLGLSNIVVMFSIFFIGKKEAVTLVVLKALFNVLMRGPIGGALSLTGGLLSVFAIILVLWLTKNKASFIFLGIVGAIFHNAGQLVVFCIVMQTWRLFLFYAPALLIAGSILGTLTGTLLKVVLPALQRAHVSFTGSKRT